MVRAASGGCPPRKPGEKPQATRCPDPCLMVLTGCKMSGLENLTLQKVAQVPFVARGVRRRGRLQRDHPGSAGFAQHRRD